LRCVGDGGASIFNIILYRTCNTLFVHESGTKSNTGFMCSVLAIRFVRVLYALLACLVDLQSAHSPFRLRSRSFSAISCTIGNDSPRILARLVWSRFFFCPDFPSFQSVSPLKCAWWDCFRTRVTATLLADRVVWSNIQSKG
jgi:hypothetical protein